MDLILKGAYQVSLYERTLISQRCQRYKKRPRVLCSSHINQSRQIKSALTLLDAQITRPRAIHLLPARVHMIQSRGMLKVCPIDGKLIVSI